MFELLNYTDIDIYQISVVLFDFQPVDIWKAMCSNAEIPISSASTEDQKSRADIAASFQVTVYEHIYRLFHSFYQ